MARKVSRVSVEKVWRRRGLTARIVNEVGLERGLWHESPEQVEDGLKHGAAKDEVLRWLRRQMERRLSPHERRCVELYYLEAQTYRQVGARMGVSATAAARSVRVAIAKLRSLVRTSDARVLDAWRKKGE